MNVDNNRSLAIGAVVLALAALLWSAPAGLQNFSMTSWPTQLFYIVLSVSGIALLIAGAWMLFATKSNHGLALAGFIAAALLAVNQATGLTLDTILCTSAG